VTVHNDYCGHMTVTGFVIKVTAGTPGFFLTDFPASVKKWTQSTLLMISLCSSRTSQEIQVQVMRALTVLPFAVRIDEAGNQAGLDMPSLKPGNIVRTKYGNDQPEVFQFTSKTTYGFLPAPGARK